jgi:hypothetical protein
MRMRANYLGSRSRRFGNGSVERLARFSGGTITHPVMFGGGYGEAEVGLRMRTVTYGYPGVLEEFEDPQTGTVWCTLAVSLPNPVPTVCVDHRSAVGRPDVPPAQPWYGETGDLEFDMSYVVSAESEDAMRALLPQKLRTVLLNRPVQRMALRNSQLLLRAFDGTEASPKLLEWLDTVASDLLPVTPGFVSPLRGDGELRPFPRGITGTLV